jgi:hypothetical protein
MLFVAQGHALRKSQATGLRHWRVSFQTLRGK